MIDFEHMNNKELRELMDISDEEVSIEAKRLYDINEGKKTADEYWFLAENNLIMLNYFSVYHFTSGIADDLDVYPDDIDLNDIDLEG